MLKNLENQGRSPYFLNFSRCAQIHVVHIIELVLEIHFEG